MKIVDKNDKNVIDFNKLIKNYSETSGIPADVGDYLFPIDGIYFLVQRDNECNNVVAVKYSESKTSLIDKIEKFVKLCIENDLIYLRVESKKNRWLPLFLRLYKKLNVNFIQDLSEIERDVVYIKLTSR